MDRAKAGAAIPGKGRASYILPGVARPAREARSAVRWLPRGARGHTDTLKLGSYTWASSTFCVGRISVRQQALNHLFRWIHIDRDFTIGLVAVMGVILVTLVALQLAA